MKSVRKKNHSFFCVCVCRANKSITQNHKSSMQWKTPQNKDQSDRVTSFPRQGKTNLCDWLLEPPPPTSCPARDCPQEKRCSVPCVKSFVINPQERNLANFRHLDWTSSVNSSCVLMVAEKLMDWYASGHIRKRRKLLISKESTAEKLHRKARPWKALGGANHVWHFRISRS